ncbi:MFS transporter [Actinomyces bowdenii]|uniref:MFS transporter n=1 Tax=Actinomyces bowdenii TaxID=131109 RepID=UPI00214C8000|nr:MFS transporter [Actinomyces bowdenii]MCR2052560.1 MFS transporter [Actinomyces bowdenii]
MHLTEDLRDLATVPAFRTLLAVRLASQSGDGMLQAGLASLFFFQPQNMTGVSGVATALVVMLLPFSLVGPLTGPLIDRWRRRQTLLHANLLRCGLVVLIAVILHTAGVGPAIYLLVLVVMGMSRFLLSVLSAGLPRIIDHERLLVANSIVPTLGGAATALGAALGLLLRLLLPPGGAQDAASLLSAALLYCAAAAIVTRLRPDQLGPALLPGPRPSAAAALAATVTDLSRPVTHLRQRGAPALALTAMSLHRFVYGMQLITLILMGRNLLAAPQDADAGLAAFGALMGAMIAGHVLAVVLTAVAHEWVEPPAWVVICLLGGTAGQMVLVATHDLRWVMAGVFVFGVGVQGAKIAVDTIVQAGTADAYRGRAFAIYDVLFNTSECLAAAMAVLVLPHTGWSPGVQGVLVVMVWAVALWFRFRMRSRAKLSQNMPYSRS